MAHGIYRIRNGWANQHSVFVDYGKDKHEVPEDRYRQDGYEPAFETLPWQDEATKGPGD